jgi:hypothetical protein
LTCDKAYHTSIRHQVYGATGPKLKHINQRAYCLSDQYGSLSRAQVMKEKGEVIEHDLAEKGGQKREIEER